MLDVEQQTYGENKAELLATAESKFVLIHGSEIVGTFESQQDAINCGYERFGFESFLVKEILPEDIVINFFSPFMAA